MTEILTHANLDKLLDSFETPYKNKIKKNLLYLLEPDVLKEHISYNVCKEFFQVMEKLPDFQICPSMTLGSNGGLVVRWVKYEKCHVFLYFKCEGNKYVARNVLNGDDYGSTVKTGVIESLESTKQWETLTKIFQFVFH